MNNLELEKTANEIRKSIVTAVHSAKSGHPGGSLSAADIFTYLYFEELNVDPKNPKDENRDRFVLSKGHVAPALYSTLAEKGFFPKEDLTTLRHTGSYLQGHPDMKASFVRHDLKPWSENTAAPCSNSDSPKKTFCERGSTAHIICKRLCTPAPMTMLSGEQTAFLCSVMYLQRASLSSRSPCASP